ncbi:hypothetical protein SAMN05216419_10565 [Nitrosomonas cryotolerans]|uniref:Uncharacterized protein n=1 Tax=Nitrosomonas cryotolerans ATCC 49181 TaxID=1131553 RepID=A0A1N6JYF1_9PROT|nr:hypothetical protein [Nitrosomonas cryotolerans]SFQ07509.1 hypothetical protein SAMN05216419_10565 [Nitrosomonas cryotolerans]SIO49259.1 hypothetical protein SAMN02743940_0035 [Nitrosomonas cryotolerans ATCC 49181]
MSWLWLISVGVSDVQFPVYKKDQCGQWNGPLRFEKGRGGIRSVHEGLLTLLQQDKVKFPNSGDELPKPVSREEARDIKLEFEVIDDQFLAIITHKQYQISNGGDAIPNDQEPALPLYCPKVYPLLKPALKLFAEEPVTVIVLNTNRNEKPGDDPDEPIASGPLVARYLAERLKLKWVDNQGNIPDILEQNVSTWIDILTGDEKMENTIAQKAVVKRLTAIIQAWKSTHDTDHKIVVTTSGGMPPLKPIIERVPATCLGQQAITLLEQSERGGPAVIAPLDYNVRVSEQETLRFHCAEALRSPDYASAYGFARRYPELPWTESVKNLLGPLLGMSNHPLQVKGQTIEQFVKIACQIEICLCMGDCAGALRLLGVFIESSAWKLIENDSRIQQWNLTVDRANETVNGDLSPNHELFEQKLLEPKRCGKHKVLGLTRRWPGWFKQGEQRQSGNALDAICHCYNKKDNAQNSARDYRNLLSHGSDKPIKIKALKSCLKENELIKDTNQSFGNNFLIGKDVNNLLGSLGASEHTKAIGQQLDDLLKEVIKA